MYLEFDTRGNDKQKEALTYWADNSTEDIVYGGCKGGGKSCLGVVCIFGSALMFPGTRYFIARKQQIDLVRHTIPSIHEVFGWWGITKKDYKFNGTYKTFELYNKSIVMLLDARELPSDPLYERFGSMQMTRGWIEEAGEFEENAYKNLRVSLGRWKNKEYNLPLKMLQTCNPKKNYLYRNYYQPFKNGTLPDTAKFIQALPQDNKCLPESYVKNLFNTLKGAARERLLLGNWEYDDDDTCLIESYNTILDLFKNSHVKKGKRYIVCDAARLGKDDAVIVVFDGFRAIYSKLIDKCKTTTLTTIIRNLQQKYSIPTRRVLVDEIGVGGGVVDQLDCQGFVSNNSVIKVEDQDNFNNLRSQCGFKLAEFVNDSKIFIDLELNEKQKGVIINEFEQLKYIESETKQKLASKDKMKEHLGHSPNWLDTFIMRMKFEVDEIAEVW